MQHENINTLVECCVTPDSYSLVFHYCLRGRTTLIHFAESSHQLHYFKLQHFLGLHATASWPIVVGMKCIWSLQNGQGIGHGREKVLGNRYSNLFWSAPYPHKLALSATSRLPLRTPLLLQWFSYQPLHSVAHVSMCLPETNSLHLLKDCH